MTTLNTTTIESHEAWAGRLKLCLALNQTQTGDPITSAVAEVFAGFKIANEKGETNAEVPVEAWDRLVNYYQQEPDANEYARMVLITDIEEMETAVNRVSEIVKENGFLIDDVTCWCLRFFNFKASRAMVLELPYIQLREDILTRVRQYTELFSR